MCMLAKQWRFAKGGASSLPVMVSVPLEASCLAAASITPATSQEQEFFDSFDAISVLAGWWPNGTSLVWSLGVGWSRKIASHVHYQGQDQIDWWFQDAHHNSHNSHKEQCLTPSKTVPTFTNFCEQQAIGGLHQRRAFGKVRADVCPRSQRPLGIWGS